MVAKQRPLNIIMFHGKHRLHTGGTTCTCASHHVTRFPPIRKDYSQIRHIYITTCLKKCRLFNLSQFE